MGLTVIVNMLTVVHKGSNGMSISFPDVCKTPTPGGPVPIPYPNIAKSSDVMSGSSTVKMDGGMIMNKSSNMMMSTGDEAGAAMGVVSNKIKGKAEFVNYSFDVKVDGKNVCRLTDPAQSNMGSGNSIAPACVQAPKFAGTPQLKACKKVKAKEKKDDKKKKGKKTGWRESGVHDDHKEAFETVAKNNGVVIYIRRGSEECLKWIGKKFKPKPHSMINGNTLTKPERFEKFKDWLDKYWGMQDTIKGQIVSKKYKNCSPPIPKPENYKSFTGIVIDNKSGAPYPGGTGKFKGKYVTGDYDLMDVVKHDDPNCSRLKENAYKDLRHQLNKEMGWPGVQHGPQAYWTSKPEDWKKGAEKFSIPKMMTGYLAKCAGAKKGDPKPEMPFVTVAKDPIRKMPILDTKLTVVAPGRVAKLDDKESVDALICCGCHKEESRKMDQTLEKKPPIPSGEG